MDAKVLRATGIGLLAATIVAIGLSAATPAAAAEGFVLGAGRAGAVQDSYIVQLKDSASPRSASARTARDLTATYGGQVSRSWQNAVNGFAVRMSTEQARRLAADPRVATVEQDAKVAVTDTQSSPPSWGLDRIDQRNLPLTNGYGYSTTAATVHAYVIDTGIRITHAAFGGRASWGTNTTGDGNNTDCNGHGTHVAGTIGGAPYGVAKGVALVAVKVLDCAGSGSLTQIIDGINWVTANAVKPAVANMSLGATGTSATLEAAVRSSIASGVTYALASGNSNIDACNFTPARVAEAITVNASDSADARASFSDFGSCTDIFAPGLGITSAWNSSDTATNTISGTSMATPHVTGAAALWLAARPADSPAAVQAGLLAAATTGKITNPGQNSPNRLLFTNPGGTVPSLPSVSGPGTQTGTVGTAASLQLVAAGGTAPYTWTATGLPAGLSVSASGLISGTPSAAAGYTVTVTARDTAVRTASATFSWTVAAAPVNCPAVTNGADVQIPDLSTVTSAITVSGCPAKASTSSTVEVHIKHPYRGDLVVDLIAPDGTAYSLQNRTGGAVANLDQLYRGDLSVKTANGVWTLRVRDAARGNVGYLDSWTLDL